MAKRHAEIWNKAEHIEPFVRSFVKPHRQDRYLRKPAELIERVCHQLEAELDFRHAIELPGMLDANLIIDEACKRGAGETACLIHGRGKLGRGPMGQLVEIESLRCDPSKYEWWIEAAIVSYVPGQLVYVAFEEYPKKPTRFLFHNERTR